MKIGKIILLNMLLVLLLAVGVNAAGKYIVDDANALKQDTINTVEQNLGKIENNTDVTVKFNIIKSLNGKSIDDYSKQYAKDNIKGDQYILFVTSIGDRKNKVLVGSKANSILSPSDIDNIASLPNQDFKSNNFDAGILKVGKAIDEKVTTKAVKSGKAEVVKDGYSSNVQHKTDYSGIITIILIILVIGIIIFMAIKRKINDDYEKRKKKFAQDNNLESYIDSDNNSFHSADVNKSAYSSSNDREEYNSSERNRDENSRMYNNSSYNNTTIIHEHGNNGFVEGMVVGEILSEEHSNNHHHDDYDDDYRRERREPEKSYSNDTSTYTSGDWDTGSTSSWDDSSSNDSDSSTWNSNSSEDSTSSSWDSSSSGDSSSSSWDSSSNDSKSSDW